MLFIRAGQRVIVIASFQKLVNDDALVNDVDGTATGSQTVTVELQLAGICDDGLKALCHKVILENPKLTLSRDAFPIDDRDPGARFCTTPFPVSVEQLHQ